MKRVLLSFFSSLVGVLIGVSGLVSAGPPSPGPSIQPPQVPSQCPRRETATTFADLIGYLDDPNFAGTIIIPSSASIDLGTRRQIPVRSCVTIAGTRGGLDPGALLFTNYKNDRDGEFEALFRVIGQSVQIKGLRFQGPLPTSSRQATKGTVGAIWVAEGANNVLIDNNEFRSWNQGIRVDRPRPPTQDPAQIISEARLIYVTRNYFNRNANNRQGHGIGVHAGYVQIEGNLFNGNRHAVAATGFTDGGKAYLARHNYVLEKGFTESPGYYNQHFDVHGSIDGYGGTAGQYFEITYNTIRGEQTYSWPSELTRPAFMLRGRPTVGAYFQGNVVVHNDVGKAVRLKRTGAQCADRFDLFGQPIHYSYELCNLHGTENNTYNTDTAEELAAGDFDGDGRDDVFLANGTAWWYSSAGLTEWRFLRVSNLRVKDLRFGRFNTDARTDVLYSDGTSWWVSAGGTDPPRIVRNDRTPLIDCVFGDFNRDGLTDALYANGSTWSVALGASSPWTERTTSRVRAANLRVGDFTGDGTDDIFWIQSNAWQLWNPARNVVTRDQRKPVRDSDASSLVVADFDGDRFADLGQTDGTGWRWLRGGTAVWAPLRGSGGQPEYRDIRRAVFGRFSRGRGLNAIRYASSQFSDSHKYGFVLWGWRGQGFTPWTPAWQEMR